MNQKAKKLKDLNKTTDSRFFGRHKGSLLAATETSFFKRNEEKIRESSAEISSFSKPHFQRLMSSLQKLEKESNPLRLDDLDDSNVKQNKMIKKKQLVLKKKSSVKTFDDWDILPEKHLLKDRKPLVLVVKKYTILRFLVYNRLLSLPLRIEVKSQEKVFNEIFLDLHRFPDRQDYLIKSSNNFVILGDCHTPSFTSDTTTRLAIYFYGNGTVSVTATFKITLPPQDEDLLHWTERLYDYSSYFKIKLNKPRFKSQDSKPPVDKIQKLKTINTFEEVDKNPTLQTLTKLPDALFTGFKTESNIDIKTNTGNLFFKISKKVKQNPIEEEKRLQEIVSRRESFWNEKRQKTEKLIQKKILRHKILAIAAKQCLHLLVVKTALRVWIVFLLFSRIMMNLKETVEYKKEVLQRFGILTICLKAIGKMKLTVKRRLNKKGTAPLEPSRTALYISALFLKKPTVRYCLRAVKMFMKEAFRTLKTRQLIYTTLHKVVDIKFRLVRYLRIKQRMKIQFYQMFRRLSKMLVEFGSDLVHNYQDRSEEFEKPFFEIFFSIRINEIITQNLTQIGNYSPRRNRRVTPAQELFRDAVEMLMTGRNIEKRASKLPKIEYYEKILERYDKKKSSYEKLYKQLDDCFDAYTKSNAPSKSKKTQTTPGADPQTVKMANALLSVIQPASIRAISLNLEPSFVLCMLTTISESSKRSLSPTRNLSKLRSMLTCTFNDDY